MKTEMVKIKIATKGTVKINHAYIYQKADNVCAIAVDMKTKYADISCTGSGLNDDNIPMVGVEAVDGSIDPRKIKKGEPEITSIYFPEYDGWNIWSTQVSKDAIYICLVKPIKS